MEYAYFIILTDAVRFITGPMNANYCFLKTIWRSSYVTCMLLYFDFIALTRYIFVFHLKNPSAFKDDFWIVFVNAWIKGASVIFNAAWFYQAEHQILDSYLCSGNDPTEDFKKPLKLYATTELGSLLFNLFAYARIKHHNMSKTEKGPVSRNVQLKELFLSDDVKNSMASLTTNLFSLSSICLLLLWAAYLSQVMASEVKNYTIEIYLSFLVFPVILIALFLLTYYIRHKPLRIVASVQFQDCLSHIWECLKAYKCCK